MNFHHFKTLLAIASLFSCLLLQSCYCKMKDDEKLENSFYVGFTLLDQQTEIKLLGNYYPTDSVKVFNGRQEPIATTFVEINRKLYFEPYQDLELPVEKDITDYYYLHLIKNGLDIDTFRIDYRVSLDDCSEKQFTYLNAFYNGELFFNSNEDYFPVEIYLYK